MKFKYFYRISNYDVRVGSTTSGQGGTVHIVKQQIRHPNFNYEKIDYDFALFELEKPVVLNQNAQIVKLAESGDELKNGDIVSITGWGATEVINIMI